MGQHPHYTTEGELAALYAKLPLSQCDCVEQEGCFRIVPPMTALCQPCEEGYHAHGYAGNWVPHPASVTVRPRAAVFDWEGQAQLYASDLATLNARDVRRAGLLNAARAHVPKELREQIDLELERR